MSKKSLNAELSINRREFFISAGAIALSTTLPEFSFAKEENSSKKAKVVVIGGGYGGITAAKYIKKQNPSVSVLLIEKNDFFVSCPMSNHYLADLMEFGQLCFPYNNLWIKHGIDFIKDEVVAIEIDKKIVRTVKDKIQYDFLILSPGIDYDIEDKPYYQKAIERYPVAFKPGSEHLYLKRLLDEFEEGDIVITVPPYPYRCPPAPYERAALIANYIKRNKLKAHLYFIDSNERPVINADGFMSAYYDLYKDLATYVTGTDIKDIDLEKKIVKTTSGDFKFDFANFIPPMKASKLMEKSGLLKNNQKWVEVNSLTFETEYENVFVIGDSARTFLSKSGYAANSQAKVVADIITERISGKKRKEELFQMVCYSMVNEKEAIMVETSYKYDKENKRFIPIHREDNQRKEQTAKRYIEWAKGLWRDLFG